MKDLWGKFMLAVLLLSQIAIPFIWLYGAMNYSPPRGRLILACSAGLWSCTIFIRIKNHPIVDVAFKNGVAILISVFIRNIPYSSSVFSMYGKQYFIQLYFTSISERYGRKGIKVTEIKKDALLVSNTSKTVRLYRKAA